MRSTIVSSVALIVAACLAASGSALERGTVNYTLSGPKAETSAWPTPAAGFTWGGGPGAVTESYQTAGPKPNTAMLTWKLPTSIGPAGAKGSITVTAGAGSEAWAPGFSVSGSLIGCTGITNTPSYGTGCADGDHAAVAVSLNPGQSKTVTQEFLVEPGAGTITVVLPGYSQQFVYTSTAAAATNTSTTSTNAVVAQIGSMSGEAEVTHANGVREPITAGTRLSTGDQIATGVDSELNVTFSNGDRMTVHEMTQLHVADIAVQGSRQNVTVAVKLGEVSAQVNPRKEYQTDFNVQTTYGGSSVRDSGMEVFYDPTSRAEIIATLADVSTFTPRGKHKSITIPVGKEIAVTRSGVSSLAPIGKADARGGDDRAVAYELATKVLSHSSKACALTTGTFSTRPAAAGWAVDVKVVGKVSGVSTWLVSGRLVTAENPLAKQISGSCG